ncbi:MAG TPA: hypothetical protein VF909_16710 [Roseiflexaceae bacterium]
MSVNLWTSSLRRLLSDMGRGGSSWAGTRATVSLGTLSGYAIPDLPSSLALALLGERAAAPGWYWVASSSVDARVGDILTSGTLVFTVRTSDIVASVRLCRIEPKR